MTLTAPGLGHIVARLVAGALSLAAAAAIVAILTGGFEGAGWQVIATSTLFAIVAATGGAGADLARRTGGARNAVGALVLAASILVFAVVTPGMWLKSDSAGLWRVAGVLGIIALDGAHACFVLARRRAEDTDAVRLTTAVAVWASAISATMGTLAVVGIADHGPWQPLAVVLIVQLLATALAPILRRTGGQRQRPVLRSQTGSPQAVAGELRAVADELERGPSVAEARALGQRIRALAGREGRRP